MADLMNLVAVSIGSLAFGVLSAYWILRAAFACMRPQPKRAVSVEVREAEV
jgi:hypothetical protein